MGPRGASAAAGESLTGDRITPGPGRGLGKTGAGPRGRCPFFFSSFFFFRPLRRGGLAPSPEGARAPFFFEGAWPPHRGRLLRQVRARCGAEVPMIGLELETYWRPVCAPTALRARTA